LPRLTARGYTLLGIGAGTYVAARVLGTWELYFLSVSFLVAPLLCWLFVLLAARKLSATRTLKPSQPLAGDDLTLRLRVASTSLLPGLQVTFEDAVGELSVAARRVDFEGLGPRASHSEAVRLPAARRGVHKLPALQAVAGDPLGLARTRRDVGEPLQVTVYPRLVPLRSCVLYADLGTHHDGGRRGLVAMGTSEFRGIRPHYPGEPLKHVDWKATAKTSTLMLREMDDPSSNDVTLVLDGTASLVTGEFPQTNFELAVRAAGSVADYSLLSGRGVNLVFHEQWGRQLRISPDADGRRQLLHELAKAVPNARAPLASVFHSLRASGGRLARTQMLMLVALALDDDLVRALTSLRREGVRVSVLHVLADQFASPASRGEQAPFSPLEGQGPARAGASGDGDANLLLSLAAAGVLCLRLGRDDDLGSALSSRHPESFVAEQR
jgi:uncharacterized protein (DUF58 family)